MLYNSWLHIHRIKKKPCSSACVLYVAITISFMSNNIYPGTLFAVIKIIWCPVALNVFLQHYTNDSKSERKVPAQSASGWEWLTGQGMLEGFPSALPFWGNHPTNITSFCTFSSSLLWKLSSKCWKWVSDIWRSKDKRQETYSPCWPNEKLFHSDHLKFHRYKA